jgi:hypothetical protein
MYLPMVNIDLKIVLLKTETCSQETNVLYTCTITNTVH